MNDRALIRAGTASAFLAAMCCPAPLVAVGLPPAGLGAWAVHHRRAKAAVCEKKIHR